MSSNSLPVGTLEVSEGTQYGQTRYYPENETARLFCKLLGKEVLIPAKIALIKQLGYRVMLVPKPQPPPQEL